MNTKTTTTNTRRDQLMRASYDDLAGICTDYGLKGVKGKKQNQLIAMILKKEGVKDTPKGAKPAPKATAKKPKAAKVTTEKKPRLGVGAYARELILKDPTVSNGDIHALVLKKFPTANTSKACVAWYRGNLIKKGELKAVKKAAKK